MNQPLRPMNLGEILDRTFQIYRSRFLVFVGIAAFPALVMMALQLANQFWWKILPEPSMRRIFLWYTPQDILYGLVLMQGRVPLNLFTWPAFALAASKGISDEPFGLVKSLSSCFKRWRGWIGLTATNWSLQLLAPEVFAAALLMGAAYLMFELLKVNPDYPFDFVFLACLALGFAAFQWVGSTIALSAPAWTIEEMRIGSAIRRAFKLSRGSRWRMVIARIAPVCIDWALTAFLTEFIFVLLYLFFRRSSDRWFSHRDLYTCIVILMRYVVAALVGPIYPIAITLFYYDQRIRKEGYDIEQMMQAAGWTTDSTPVSQPLPSPEALLEAQA